MALGSWGNSPGTRGYHKREVHHRLPTCGYAFSSTRTGRSSPLRLTRNSLWKWTFYPRSWRRKATRRMLRYGKSTQQVSSLLYQNLFEDHHIAVLYSHLELIGASGPPPSQDSKPNVHMEYGLMLAFRKYVLPFQRRGDLLAFNIQP